MHAESHVAPKLGERSLCGRRVFESEVGGRGSADVRVAACSEFGEVFMGVEGEEGDGFPISFLDALHASHLAAIRCLYRHADSRWDILFPALVRNTCADLPKYPDSRDATDMMFSPALYLFEGTSRGRERGR